jgi:proliferating cell nuclear antigen
MVRLKTIQATAFRTIFEVLKDIMNDINLVFRPDGILIVTLDTARVTLIHVFMPAENFEEYTCDHECTAGLNVSNTYKLLKSVTNTDTLTLNIDDQYILNIHVQNVLKKTNTTFQFKLLDINDDMLSVPEIEMNVLTTIPSIDFQRIIRDMYNLGQIINIKRSRETIEFSCEGGLASQKTVIEYFKGLIHFIFRCDDSRTFMCLASQRYSGRAFLERRRFEQKNQCFSHLSSYFHLFPSFHYD